MAHLNHRSLRLLSHISSGLVLDDKPTEECIICIEAKAHRKSYPPSSSRATVRGELVHSDICYVGIPTVNDEFKYFVTFLDDATRFLVVYLLRLKADTFAAFQHYDRRLSNLTGKHIQTLRSDGGLEYFSNSMKTYCNEFGIFQQQSTRHTPEQNGRSERVNRSILEGALSLLIDAGLDKNFWGYAVQTYVWLKNRSPHAALYRSTPYECWNNSKPDLSCIRIFGTLGYVHIPSKIRGDKFEKKVTPMILVGYSERSKAYIMFDLTTSTELLSSEVMFVREGDFSNDVKNGIPDAFRAHLKELDHHTSDTPDHGAPNEKLNADSESGIELLGSTTRDEAFCEVDITQIPNSPDSNGYKSDESIDPLTSYNNSFTCNDALMADVNIAASSETNDSPTFYQAMNGPFKKQFLEAIHDEYSSLAKNHVFSKPCQLPVGKKAIDTKLVLKIKESESDDVPRRFKARLCGRGFKQEYGVDFFETFAPVAAYNAIRTFVSLLATMDFEIDSIDIITAFLLAPLA
jgi:transposase InsO family protein